MDIYLDLVEKSKIVDSITEDWELRGAVDSAILDTVKSALSNAYTIGCIHGGLDETRFIDAVNTVKKNP